MIHMDKKQMETLAGKKAGWDSSIHVGTHSQNNCMPSGYFYLVYRQIFEIRLQSRLKILLKKKYSHLANEIDRPITPSNNSFS